MHQESLTATEMATHTVYPLRIESGGNIYDLRYHECNVETHRTVISLPGLTDDSYYELVKEVDAFNPGIPLNYMSMKFQGPFSLDINIDVILKAISATDSREVGIDSYCLGGAVLGKLLNEYAAGKYHGEFDLKAAVFRAASIDRMSFKPIWRTVIYGGPEYRRLRARLFRYLFPIAAKVNPNSELSGQVMDGTVDYNLVFQQLFSIPETVEVIIPSGVRVAYIGLDKDPLIDNDFNIRNLGIAEEHVRILRSSTQKTRHRPEDPYEMYALVSRLMREGFGE
jgi:hypothetical protein